MRDGTASDASAHEGGPWPEDGRHRWVADPRKSAPGLDALLVWASGEGASRVAFQPGHPVWVSVHGRNRRATAGALDEAEFSAVVNHLYGADGMARLQGGNDFDTAYSINLDRSRRLRYRLNATPTRRARRDGGNVVLRPMRDLPPTLAEQRVEPGIVEGYRPREGLVVVSGATGSGKSTLLAGIMVARLTDPESHANIVEAAAPVEFLLEGVGGPTSTMNQSEIPRDMPSFAAFVRGCMRREPTDIGVGECRDGETMGATVHASISGHKVWTTTHAGDTPSTVQRIASLCPEAERANLLVSLAQSLRLVVNQRLVPSTDGRRIALREFLPFDAGLRRSLLRAAADEWPEIVRRVLPERGQTYERAIANALEAGLITEEAARRERAEVA